MFEMRRVRRSHDFRYLFTLPILIFLVFEKVVISLDWAREVPFKQNDHISKIQHLLTDVNLVYPPRTDILLNTNSCSQYPTALTESLLRVRDHDGCFHFMMSILPVLVTDQRNLFLFHERLLDAHSGWAIVDDNRLPRSN